MCTVHINSFPFLIPHQQSIHELVIMFTLLQEGGDLGLQSFQFSRQSFVPGFGGLQLLLHIVVVFQEGFIVRGDPLEMHACVGSEQDRGLNKSLLHFFYSSWIAYAPRRPPSSLSRWSGCGWGFSPEEEFCDGAPHPETCSLRPAVFVDLIDSAAARGLATVAQCSFVSANFRYVLQRFFIFVLLTLVWRASICCERPRKLPGLLSNCWRLTSSPTSLTKTCQSHSWLDVGMRTSPMINCVNKWRYFWTARSGVETKTLPYELLSAPVWQTEPGCDTQSLSAGQQPVSPAVISPQGFPAFVNNWHMVQIELWSLSLKKKIIPMVSYLQAIGWPRFHVSL